MNPNEAPTLEASPRQRTGSRYAQRLRASGQLPAILYGHGETPEPLTMPAKTTLEHIHKGEKFFRLKMNGSEQFILLREVQFDHLGTNIVHADFSRVDANERVRVTIPIRRVGEAEGLKTAGAVLMHPVNEIEIECLVTNMPEAIEVDISSLKVGGTITASDVQLPLSSMKLLSDPAGVIAHIVAHSHEQLSAEAQTVSGESPAQPEVIRARKEEDEG